MGVILLHVYLHFVPDGHHTLLLVPLVFIGTVLLVLLCQQFWTGGVQPGGVVLCILLFNTPAATYVDYAMNRIFDTAVGVIIALIVTLVFPRGWMQLWPERLKHMRVYVRAARLHVRIHHPEKKE